MTHIKKYTSQTGLSLIELMIAITISTALLIGVVQIFSNTKSTYRTQETFSRLSEKARFALDIMAQDISMADFWGCNPTPVDANQHLSGGNQLNTGDNFIAFAQNQSDTSGQGGGLFGIEGDASLVGSPDRILVRSLIGRPTQIQPLSFANLPVQLTETNNHFQTGQIVGLTDCTKTDFFQITSTSIDGLTIFHAAETTPTIPPGNANARLSNTYGSNSTMYRAQQVEYFITPANTLGTGELPGLMRQLNRGVATELISNVEDMQIKYGEDTTGDLVVDRYIDANGAGINFDNVIAVRITLVIASDDDNVSPTQLTGRNDNRIEKTVTTTISLRNRLS